MYNRRNLVACVAFTWIVFALWFMLYSSDNTNPPPPVVHRDPVHITGDPLPPQRAKKLYFMVVPSFGPNNQYMATKEATVLAQILGRDLVQPVYIAHLVKGQQGPRAFEDTWNTTKLDYFLETFAWTSGLSNKDASAHKIQSVAFDDFKTACNNRLDALFWLRDPGQYWNDELTNYLTVTGLERPVKEINPIRSVAESGSGAFADKVFLMNQEMVEKYFAGYEETPCIGIAFPFRTVGGKLVPSVERTHRGFHHTDEVVRLANQALHEMGSSANELMHIHWRHGEATCRVEKPALHENFDFCWGTSEYYWARTEDVAQSLSDWVMKCNEGIKTIYFATDSKEVLELFKKELNKRNLKVFKASEVPVLASIKDNYYLSLVEQELALQSKSFLGSGGTTWSEEMINYRKYNFGHQWGTCQLWTLTDLMRTSKKPLLTHNYWDHILKGTNRRARKCLPPSSEVATEFSF